jgi:hypothetical protein
MRRVPFLEASAFAALTAALVGLAPDICRQRRTKMSNGTASGTACVVLGLSDYPLVQGVVLGFLVADGSNSLRPRGPP